MPKPKLLIYTPMNVRYGGGFEAWLFKVVETLSQDYDITVASGSIGRPLRLTQGEAIAALGPAKLEAIRFLRLGMGHPVYLIKPQSFLKLLHLFKETDEVYFNYAFILQELLVLILSKLTNKPVLVGFHAPLSFEKKHDFLFDNYAAKVLKQLNAFHVVNSDDRETLMANGLQSVNVIPNFIFYRETEEVPKAERKSRLLFVGRYERQKGLDILVEAARKLLRSKVSGFCFAFYGSGSLAWQVRDLVKEFPKDVHDYGFTQDKLEIYRDRDVLIVPSRQEPFGLVILEAFARGIPVISSDSSGSRLMVRHGDNGLIIPDLTVDGLVATIGHAFTMTLRQRQQMGQRGKHMVQATFTEHNFYREFKRALKTIKDG